MSERAKKSIGQDLVGVLFCILGVYFGVSILLHLFGQEPVVAFATQPVLELVALLGPAAALLLSLGAAALGAWVFLSAAAPAVGRPLAALALGSACAALIAGAWAYGGGLGDVFPGLVSGLAGRLIGAVLGVVVGWLALTLLPRRQSGSSTADLMRAGLGSRGDLAAGVSAAEAALLVSDPRPAARPAPKRDEPVRREVTRPIAPEAKPRPSATAALAATAPAPAAKDHAELPPPVAPSWESEEPAEELAPEDEEERELAAELAGALSEDEDEEELEADEEEEPRVAPQVAATAAEANTPPPASWEQVSLFDEEGEELEEPAEEAAAPARPAALTPAFAFEEPSAPRHEPERATADDPFAAEPVTPPALIEPEEFDEELERDDEEEFEEQQEAELEAEEAATAPEAELVAKAAPTPTPAPAPEFVLQPKPAPRPEPVVEPDGERGRWEKLVFDSGILIVEQKRVAVSMLERRFGIDFDSACKVLDELQQAGLIGPYIGGRTREILLTREQWLAQAPQTA